MSGSVNKAIILGRLARDPESRSTQAGSKIVNMTVVTSERWKDKSSGEQKERAEFHRVVLFNEHLADLAEKYLRKGSQVAVEGQIETRKWQDQSGQDRYSTEIVVRPYRGELTLLDSKPRDEGAGQQALDDGIPWN